MSIQKATKYLEDIIFRSNVYHLDVIMVKLMGMPAKQWGWTQDCWPKRIAEFLLHML
jgi:ribosomal protein L22